MQPTLITLDIGVICTVIGTGVAVVMAVYKIIKTMKSDFQKRNDFQDERIFQLATGKSLREAMMEAKRKAEGQ